MLEKLNVQVSQGNGKIAWMKKPKRGAMWIATGGKRMMKAVNAVDLWAADVPIAFFNLQA